MCKDTINQRFIFSVNYIISEKIASTKAFIAQELGIKSSKFSEILNHRMGVSAELISIFCTKFNISVDYIIYGKGSILKTNPPPDDPIAQEPRIEYNKPSPCKLCIEKDERLKEKDERIQDLKEMISMQKEAIFSLIQQIEPLQKHNSASEDVIQTRTG